jgi:phenylalanyl-tRNA synthetase beta chain
MAFKLSNALSPDLQYYRMSLTPSLLSLVHPNIKSGYNSFALFEIGKVHASGFIDPDKLPVEFERTALVIANNKKGRAAPYYEAKQYLTSLLDKLGLEQNISFEALDSPEDISTTFYASNRSATVKVGEVVIGRIGEYKPNVRKALKLPAHAAGFELGLTPLMKLISNKKTGYKPLSRYPSVSQDICLQVPQEITYGQLTQQLRSALNDHLSPDQTVDVQPLDIYTSEEIGDKKRITYRVKLTSSARTLTEDALSTILDQVATKLAEQLAATRI